MTGSQNPDKDLQPSCPQSHLERSLDELMDTARDSGRVPMRSNPSFLRRGGGKDELG